MRTRILPYRQGSRSARSLADGIRGRVLRLEGSSFRPRATDTIINWGSTDENRQFGLARVKNPPNLVRTASNKLSFFNRMSEQEDTNSIIPNFWTTQDQIPDEAFPIVCRTVLAGHSGDGIVIADTRDTLVPAPLYVQYIKKQSEFRIHVGLRNGEAVVIAEQKKVKRADAEEVDFRIRNHAGGFIFQRNGIEIPEVVREAAKSVLLRSRLDFGAVDVIYNARNNRAYVLEINTAPGLEGQTVQDYVTFFIGDN